MPRYFVDVKVITEYTLTINTENEAEIPEIINNMEFFSADVSDDSLDPDVVEGWSVDEIPDVIIADIEEREYPNV